MSVGKGAEFGFTWNDREQRLSLFTLFSLDIFLSLFVPVALAGVQQSPRVHSLDRKCHGRHGLESVELGVASECDHCMYV